LHRILREDIKGDELIMPIIGEAGFVFKQRELLFLAALVGCDEIYGIQDNIAEMKEKEIIEEWNKARGQLQNKKYINVNDDESITIDDDLYVFLKACCKPRAYIKYVGSEDDGILHQRNLYINEKTAVELDQDRLNKDVWILTPLVSIEKAAYNLKECFILEKKYEDADIKFEISQGDFERFNNVFVNNEKSDALKMLSDFGCPEEFKEDLFNALKCKKVQKTILMILDNYDNISDIFNFSIFGGEKYLWKINVIKTNDMSESKVVISTTTAQSIEKEVENMVLSLRHIYV